MTHNRLSLGTNRPPMTVDSYAGLRGGHLGVLSRLPSISDTESMKSRKSLYHRRRFPQEIIRHTVWLYHRFCLSYRDVEDLLSERGIKVSYETIRRWCTRFGPTYANRVRRKDRCGGDQWFVDEVFVRIDGELRYLYRAVDQDGQVLDILVQTRRNTQAATRFFRRLLKQ